MPATANIAEHRTTGTNGLATAHPTNSTIRLATNVADRSRIPSGTFDSSDANTPDGTPRPDIWTVLNGFTPKIIPNCSKNCEIYTETSKSRLTHRPGKTTVVLPGRISLLGNTTKGREDGGNHSPIKRTQDPLAPNSPATSTRRQGPCHVRTGRT